MGRHEFPRDIPMTRLREELLKPENKPNYMVARACGLSPCHLSLMALGRRTIPIHHLETLCEYLNVSPADLLGPPTTFTAAYNNVR